MHLPIWRFLTPVDDQVVYVREEEEMETAVEEARES